MNILPKYPALYQINTRVWLTELSHSLGRPAMLDDIRDAELDRLAAMGFDWVWFLSVWQTGPAAQKVSRSNAGWRHEFQETLPDLREDDIAGSGFAITGYAATPIWQRHRRTTAACNTSKGPLGARLRSRPYFDGWPDTLQLNYGNPALQQAMIGELERIAWQCDGVRCDMAMLVLPEVFERTWGVRSQPFWPAATRRVREQNPDFCFMAEVYWDMGWTLQQQGFDYTYDKRLYDRLREGHAPPVLGHLHADLEYQNKMARFLENHDEPRAASTFATDVHEAAAVLTFLSPGLRFFHQGQFQGRKKRISPHLVRAPEEPIDKELLSFYERTEIGSCLNACRMGG